MEFLNNLFKPSMGDPALGNTVPLAPHANPPRDNAPISRSLRGRSLGAPLGMTPPVQQGEKLRRREIPVAEGIRMPSEFEGRMLEVELGAILDAIPPHFVRSGKHDRSRKLIYSVAELFRGIATGKPTIGLLGVSARAPEIFRFDVSPADDMEIPVPLKSLVIQIGEFPVRNDSEPLLEVRQIAIDRSMPASAEVQVEATIVEESSLEVHAPADDVPSDPMSASKVETALESKPDTFPEEVEALAPKKELEPQLEPPVPEPTLEPVVAESTEGTQESPVEVAYLDAVPDKPREVAAALDRKEVELKEEEAPASASIIPPSDVTQPPRQTSESASVLHSEEGNEVLGEQPKNANEVHLATATPFASSDVNLFGPPIVEEASVSPDPEPQPEPEPEPVSVDPTPELVPPPPPKNVPTFPALQELLHADEPPTVAEAAERICELPSVRGCVVHTGRIAERAGEVPGFIHEDALADAAMLLFSPAEGFAARLQVGDIQSLTLANEDLLTTFFRSGSVTMLIVHADRDFPPGIRARLGALTHALARALAGGTGRDPWR